MKPVFPDSILAQHIAVLGKTGSGKTSTAKLLVEQVVESGSRVCILDPVKSDWWGLTSSADGKRAGLPFHILGGKHGHVSLHPQAGNAIGEIVASGQLPLSILDMSDFEMGGLQQFFVHFAPAILRKMRGVLYLVIEEAHEFAPKERAGFGQENMAIHFAKKLATAGRSKGIRMIIATQRTQALHNAVLGSCETMIAHRLISPADQEPVAKWLRANLTKEKAKEVESSLSTLKTGEAWVCSGESGLFERRQFPRISTYDNSATPDADSGDVSVKTAEVDRDKLRSIIGTAVEEAKSNDPAELKRKIVVLERQLACAKSPASPERVEIKVPDREKIAELTDRMNAAIEACGCTEGALEKTSNEIVRLRGEVENLAREIKHQLSLPQSMRTTPSLAQRAAPLRKSSPVAHHDVNGSVGKCELAILRVLAQYQDGCDIGKIALLSGYRVSGGFRNSLSSLRGIGAILGDNTGIMHIAEGADKYGPFEPLPQGDDLQAYWLNHRSFGKCEKAILAALLDSYPQTIDQLAKNTGYEVSGGFRNSLSNLRTAGVIVGGNTGLMQPSEDLL